ncbi:hypothetical protein GA0074692_6863 [Micromonospora pallida]|uniref:DUF732 domain-containing protein n=1 Tax=Micromonospora pallida TaxID=145854 RepID=A0A1C6RGN0_9ACTN|nr:hypothetical protein [Micromonospora pallida]SCL16327.1 hypothetical protein GA0074692_0004 [Micromonospora pallida]SCL43401.1 hypothetical protein GA0074692_6863 [Micromonospora pallida]
MRARHVAVAVVAAIALAGCGSSEETPEATPTTPGAISSEAVEKALEAAGIPPKPDQKTADAYLAALRKIDPDIVGDKDPDRIIDRGRDQCRTIKDWPNDEAKVIMFANTRFTSPDQPNGFGEAKAKKINEVVRKHLCPSY